MNGVTRSLFFAFIVALSVALARCCVAAVPTQSQPAAVAAGAAARCTLQLEGLGRRPGLSRAQLSCEGGSINVAGSAELRQALGSSNKGVVWSNDPLCNAYLKQTKCLLVLCGPTVATFTSPRVISIYAKQGHFQNAVCVTGGAQVTFRSGVFAMNMRSRPMSISDATTRVNITNCTFANNENPQGVAASLAVLNSRVHISSSHFHSNSASNGGAIIAGGISRVDISHEPLGTAGRYHTTFSNNAADLGGAIYIEHNASVTIVGAEFHNNTATAGGAVCAGGRSNLTLQESVIRNCTTLNVDTNGGGGVAVLESARLVINNTTITGCRSALGGGIHIAQWGSAVTHGLECNDNNATQGGCCYITGFGRASFDGGRLMRNTATLGGAVAMLSNSSAVIHSMSIRGCTATVGGGAHVVDNARLSVTSSSIARCRASGGGGLAIMASASAVVQNTSLLNNIAAVVDLVDFALGGGMLGVGRANVTLQDCLFDGNQGDSGGAFALLHQVRLQLLGVTSLFNNRARRAGGAAVLDTPMFDQAELQSRLQLSNNSAPVGANVSFGILKLEMVGSNSSLDNFVAKDSEGGILHVTFKAIGPQGLPGQGTIMVSITDANHSSSTKALTTVNSTSQPLTQVGLKLRNPPGWYRLVFLVTDDVRVPPATLMLHIVPCPKGYVTASTGDACIRCVRGYFGFDPEQRECEMCVPNAECPGGAVVWPAKGWWSSAQQSKQMHRCFNPAACVGGEAAANTSGDVQRLGAADYKTSLCAEQYQGNLCGSCRQGYGKVRAFLCRKCLPTGLIVVLYIIAAAFMVGLVTLLRHLQIISSNDNDKDGSTSPAPTQVDLLKILVLHGQWLYIISNLIGIPWPPSLSWPMQVLSGVWSSASGSSIGIDCILPTHSPVPVPVQKLILCVLLPLVVMCFVLLLEAIMQRCRRDTTSSVRDAFASLAICVAFVFLPTWVGTVLSLFTCVTLDQPAVAPFAAEAVGSFWVEDMDQLCYSTHGYHRGWALGLGIPLTLLFCLCLPVGLFCFLWRSRATGKLAQEDFEQHYGFLYMRWREGVCWWEAVVVSQTIGLVGVATFGYAMGPYHQCLATAALLVSIYMLLGYVRPYARKRANHVAMQSVAVLFFTAWCALTFLSCNGISPGLVYGIIMGCVVLLLNLSFLMITSWRLLQQVNWQALRAGLHGMLKKPCGGCCMCSHRRQAW